MDLIKTIHGDIDITFKTILTIMHRRTIEKDAGIVVKGTMWLNTVVMEELSLVIPVADKAIKQSSVTTLNISIRYQAMKCVP